MKKLLFLSIPLLLLGAAVIPAKNYDANYADFDHPISIIGDGKSFDDGFVKPNPWIIDIKPKFRKYTYDDVVEGQTLTGFYSQFTNIGTEASYLGYGYNVISSPYMDKDYVYIRNPIIDRNKIKTASLMLVKETRSEFKTSTGSSMESFMQNYGASMSVYGNYLKFFSGGIKAEYRGSSDEQMFYSFAKSEYQFRTFDLHLAETDSSLREMLSSNFKYDLLNMPAGELFDTYGTHLICEVAMGGRIEINTTYSSTVTEYSNEVEAAINAHVKYMGSSVNTEISANYSGELENQNISSDTYVKTLGGPIMNMSTPECVRDNLDVWTNTLDEDLSKSALVGIVGPQSLVPIWDLLGAGNQQRKDELEEFFAEKADDEYESLCSQYKLNMNRYVNVAIEGEGTVSGSDEQYRSGDLVTLSAIPEPGNDFEGWYDGDQKVSSDINYSFIIRSNTNLIAKFVPGTTTVGDGTQNNPYIIFGVDGFRDIANDMSAYYKIGRDIDFNNEPWAPITGKFTGYLDGNNHTLSNIKIENLNGPFYSYSYFGLFQKIGSSNGNGGYVHNLKIKDSSLRVEEYGGASAGVNAGLLCGEVDNGRVEYCEFIDTTLSNNITRSIMGTMAGTASGSIKNVTIKGTRVYGYAEIGGLAGNVGSNTEIENCVVTKSSARRSEINLDAHKNQRFNCYAGGISGYGNNVKIRYCNVEYTDYILTGELNKWPAMGYILGYSVDGFAVNITNNVNTNTKMCSDSSATPYYFAAGDGICGEAIRTVTSFAN